MMNLAGAQLTENELMRLTVSNIVAGESSITASFIGVKE
ncbi:ComF operon protein A [Lacticaseibacillus paracasei]|nr:ComF operon protein A [Lacticaseibacillus paracasei]